jgi:tetratricopeptide (TPR) repeat protein
VKRFFHFDGDADEPDELRDGPRFDVPVLGLFDATVGQIALAADAFFQGQSSLNRQLFHQAVAAEDEEAAHLWMACLHAGDGMAHFGLGYTLLELGEAHDAYRHLRHYTELAPSLAWAWCYRGRAAAALGDLAEARMAYRRAIALEPDDDPTTARELLAALRAASG